MLRPRLCTREPCDMPPLEMLLARRCPNSCIQSSCRWPLSVASYVDPNFNCRDVRGIFVEHTLAQPRNQTGAGHFSRDRDPKITHWMYLVRVCDSLSSSDLSWLESRDRLIKGLVGIILTASYFSSSGA